MAQTKPKAGQFYGVSDNGTDGQFLKTDGTGGMSWDSPITNPTITSIDYPGTQTAADPAGGESVIINGTLFASGITCTVGGTSAVTAFNSATQITITTPAKAAGQYAVAVTNSDGGTASQANFIQYSGVPVWSTASGSLGNVLEGAAASFQVTATEGSDTIEYAVTTGTLPTGLSLNTATGAITGTAPAVSADTTTTFSITATDDENQTSSERSFSITVQNDLPSNYFNTVLYTGNGGTQSISTLDFQPDLVWVKKRSSATSSDHQLNDSFRGVNKILYPNLTNAEDTAGGVGSAYFNSFDSNGFTVGSSTYYNGSGETYVAWNFKAGGAAVANTDGTINSQVSVNNTLGFSIVSYSGNSTSGATVGHGLDAAPDFVIIKSYNTVANWIVYSSPTGNGKYLYLNSASGTSSANWFDTSATTFTLNNTYGDANTSGRNYIAYNFASKPGFSKVGSYTGNGSASGPIVQTGFEPAFLMIKRTDVADNWILLDNKRSVSNPRTNTLFPNLNSAELTSGFSTDFLANGFQLKTSDNSMNSNGGTYIYMAFAADGSTATPSLANSFATDLYTGPGTPITITTGIPQDLVFNKSRNASAAWRVSDTVRGPGYEVYASEANAQAFDANGISVYGNTSYDIAGNWGGNFGSNSFVSYAWKAGGTPSINTDGTITSIVSANQAAGFSIVSYTAGGAANVGHGLNSAPELIITKNLDASEQWFVYSAATGTQNFLGLNTTSAVTSNSGTYTSVTNTTFTNNISGTSRTYINYCFTSISGYSKVGSYTGTSGSVTVSDVGFQPTFLLIKGATAGASFGGSWLIVDSARGDGGFNTAKFLLPNSSGVEFTNAVYGVTFTSNGFTIPSGSSVNLNTNNGTFIYLAIKEN